MSEFFDELLAKHCDFIEEQQLFTVATAPTKGRINLSPRGLDSFRIINSKRVAWLDLVGSGNETAAHLKENGRITIMFMSFTRTPLIMRLYGAGYAVHPGDDEFDEYIGLFTNMRGVRQIMIVDIDNLQTSCGYGVPRADNVRARPTLEKWAESKDEDELYDYQMQKNVRSIDGLDTGLFDKKKR